MNETFMKEKPIFPLLMSMALPMVISMLINSLYNIVDSFFVAKISEGAMTALSLVFPVQNFINSAAIGFGVGINALISFHLGAKNQPKADTAATHGVLLSVLHGIVLTVVCIAVMPAFLKAFTSDPEILHLAVTYSRIVFCFSIILMLNLSFEKIFQSVGRMNASMLALIVGCVTNIILDPLLIFGIGIFPALGIAGAAIATGIGQTVPVLVYLILYFIKPLPVKIRRSCMKPDKKIESRLYAVGVPAALNMALPSLLISVLNGLLATFSGSYVVILGIYYKLQTFLYMPANGLVQGMRPLVGYNYGAGEIGRVKKIHNLALSISAGIMLIGTVLCLIFAAPLMGMFTTHPDTIAAGATALRIICIGFLSSSVSVTSCGALEGLGKGTPSLWISLCRFVIVIIPLAFLLSRFMGAVGVWHAFWITELITAVIAVFIYRKALR